MSLSVAAGLLMVRLRAAGDICRGGVKCAACGKGWPRRIGARKNTGKMKRSFHPAQLLNDGGFGAGVTFVHEMNGQGWKLLREFRDDFGDDGRGICVCGNDEVWLSYHDALEWR